MAKSPSLLVAAALAVATFAAPAPAGTSVPVIGLAVANLDADFFNQIKQAVEASGNQRGVKVLTVNAKGDAELQARQVNELLTKKINALIYIPAGATAADAPVRAARAAGVPVVAVDRTVAAVPPDSFIATDSVAAARALGEYVIAATGGKGAVAIVQGQLGTTPQIDRDRGFGEALAKAPGLKVVAREGSLGWRQDEGRAIMQGMLKANPSINVVFGQADALAIGAAQAVKTAQLNRKVIVVGFDGDVRALKAVKSGVLQATMTQQTQLMGRMSFDSAVKLAAGGKVPAVQLLPAALTTRDNVDRYIAEHP